jgi:hypothetical protein
MHDPGQRSSRSSSAPRARGGSRSGRATKSAGPAFGEGCFAMAKQPCAQDRFALASPRLRRRTVPATDTRLHARLSRKGVKNDCARTGGTVRPNYALVDRLVPLKSPVRPDQTTVGPRPIDGPVSRLVCATASREGGRDGRRGSDVGRPGAGRTASSSCFVPRFWEARGAFVLDEALYEREGGVGDVAPLGALVLVMPCASLPLAAHRRPPPPGVSPFQPAHTWSGFEWP